jgi:hypothetical protein
MGVNAKVVVVFEGLSSFFPLLKQWADVLNVGFLIHFPGEGKHENTDRGR